MKVSIARLARAVYSIYSLIVFLVLMLITLVFVFLASFAGRVRGGNFIYQVLGCWADCWFFFIGIWHRNIYITPLHKEHPVIYVINHISYIDIPVVVKSIRQPIRILGKIEMAKIPLFGYIYRKSTVMVDRSSARNRAKSVGALKAYLKKNISIVIFPEGTFNETGAPLKSFYDGAFRIAIETQTPIKPVVFLDTVNRMYYESVLGMTPGISRAVFLEEVPVEGLTMKDLDELKDKVYKMMEHCIVNKNYGR